MTAKEIIEAMGGAAEAAALLGVQSKNTVQYWAWRGRIPAKHWADIAKSGKGITLSTLAEHVSGVTSAAP